MISFTYLVAALTAVGLIAVGALLPWQPPAQAAAGINKTITFQGRMLNNVGAVVADGNYNVRLIVYCDGDGVVGGADPGSCSGSGSAEHILWTELWQNSVATGSSSGVQVRNGYFSITLGTYCLFTGGSCQGNTNNGVDWNQDTLWLSMEIGGTAVTNTPTYEQLSPFRRMTSAVYALQTGTCSSCILQAPTSTAQNTIAPTTNSVVALTVKGTTGTAANVLEVFDSTGTPTRQAFFDNTGALNVAKAIQPTTNNAVDVGLSGTAFRTGYFATSVVTPLVNAAAALALQSGSGSSISATPGGTGDVVINTDADSQLQVTQATAAPGVDQITVTNAGFGVTSTDVSNLRLSFTGGAAAVEAGAEYISLNPSSTSGSTWNGLKVVHNTTGPATGVTTNGAKFVGPTSGGAGTYNAINVNSIGAVASGGVVRGVNITGTNSQTVGTQTGINVNNLAPAGAIETGVNVGHGWDSAIQVQATAAFTQTTAQTGINLDYNTTFTGATGQNITGLSMSNPASLTVTSATSYTGVNLGATAGSYTSNGGNFTYTGLKVTNPNLTQTANTASATGASLTTGTLTTGGSQTGLGITASGVGVGSLTGVAIGAITNGASTAENAMTVGSGWDNILFYNGATSLINGSGQWNLGQVTGTLAVNRGGTGQTSYVNGELLIGNTATGLLNKATLTPTANRLSVTNGTGSITLNVDATQFPNSATNGDVFRSSAANTGQWIAPTFANGMCSDCLTKTPSSTGVNTITPTGSTTGLTVNGSATATLALNVVQGQAADGVNVTTSAAGTNTNGLLVARSVAGTTTNALAVTNATGTTTNGLAITQSSGTLTNGVSFAGTIGTDITRASGTLTLQGAGGITATSGAATNINLTPSTTGVVSIGGTTPTIAYGNAASFLQFAASGTTNGNLLTIAGQNATSGTGGGITIQGGTATTGAGGTLTLSGGNTVAAGTNGAVSIDAGSGATTPNGTVTIGAANASAINIGATSVINTLVTMNGRAVVKPGGAGNANNIFAVQNASSEPIFQVDTTTGNLLQNSGFEVSTANWVAKGTTSSFATDNTSTNQYHGLNSLKAVVTAATSGMATTGGQAAFTSNITAATQYTLTFMAKCSATFATLTYGRQDVSGTDVNSVTNGNCTTTWQQFTAHWTTGGTITNPNIYVNLGATAAGSLWIDAVSLVQTTTSNAQPYDVGNILNGGIFSNPAQFQNVTDSTVAFQVQNAAGNPVMTVDTANANVILGRASTYTGNLVFNSSSSAQAVTVSAGVTGGSGYQLQWPTTIATSSQCLAAGTVAGTVVPLQFTTCGSGSGANTALSNLASVSINTDLTWATGANRALTMATAATTTFSLSVLGQNAGGTTNAGGVVTVQGGTGTTTGAGGAVTVQGGTGGSTGNGGQVTIIGGLPGATGSTGGNVLIQGGQKLSGATSGSVILKPQASNDSTNAIQIQNASGSVLMAADTTNNAIVIGAPSSFTGKLSFANSAVANTVGIQAGGTTANYTLTLPTAVGASGDCLKALDGSGALTFTACGNGVSSPGTPTAGKSGSASAANNNATCYTTVSWGAGGSSTNGNLMIAYYSNDDAQASGSPNLPSGWTAIGTAFDSTDFSVTYIAYKLAGGSEPTSYNFGYTNCLTDSQYHGVVAIEEWAGVNATTDGSAARTTVYNGSSPSIPNVTTSNANDFVVGVFGGRKNTSSSATATWASTGGTTSATWNGGTIHNNATANYNTAWPVHAITNNTGTFGATATPTNWSTKSYAASTAAFTITMSGGGGSINLQSVYTASTGFTTPEIKVDTVRNGVDIQDADTTINGTLLAVRQSNNSGLGAAILDVVSTGIVKIGSSTTDATQMNLQLDSFSTFADTGTCNTTTNQGALYYNTNTASIRTCQDALWSDVMTTKDTGLIMFGVVADTGASGEEGDLASVTDTTNLDNGPCKAYVGANTATIAWKGCIAYSGGRRVVVTAGSTATTNSTGGNFQHLCLTGSGNQPALSTSAAETSGLPTFSTTAPILCLADIRFNAANNTITQVYDARTYTTSSKIFATATANPFLSQMVRVPNGSTTPGSVTATTAVADQAIVGIVVASSGASSTTAINSIVAVSGPGAVKAVTHATFDAISNYVVPTNTGTAGYAYTWTVAGGMTSTFYGVLGVARTAWTGGTACAANKDACAGSILVDIAPR